MPALPWSVPRPIWHYVFTNGVELDYPIVDDGSQPVTLRMAFDHPQDVKVIELRLGDNCLAYATLEEPRRVGVCTGPVFDIPEDAQLYHAVCRNKQANAATVQRLFKLPNPLQPAPMLQAGSGFVLGWRSETMQRRVEVYVDDQRRRIDVQPHPPEPVTSAWIGGKTLQ